MTKRVEAIAREIMAALFEFDDDWAVMAQAEAYHPREERYKLSHFATVGEIKRLAEACAPEAERETEE